MSVAWNKRVVAAVRKWGGGSHGSAYEVPAFADQPYAARSFSHLSAYTFIERHKLLGRTLGIENPFFRANEPREGTTKTLIGGKRYLNFAWCDYLGFSHHPAVTAAAKSAIERYGTCVSASRMVAGEIPLHRELETEIAEFCGVDAALLFVSGHAANVSTIGTIMGARDLVVLDEFVHNSAVVGTRLSGAASRTFPHNNLDALEAMLRECRSQYQNVLIVIEGLYSTEGDVPNLPRIVALKERYGAWLMVDDAHGVGVLGATGRGCAECCAVDPRKIDIWMGTLSKTLASCGGYIAGDRHLIEILKYTAPGFVYSVGLLPAMAATALASLRLLKTEPERVQRLQANGRLFLQEAREATLDTGNSLGFGMLPVMVGGLARTAKVADRLFARGINVSLIVYPGVPINSGRVRFFLTSEHTPEEICFAVRAAKDGLNRWW